jgi:nitrate reductase NapE component
LNLLTGGGPNVAANTQVGKTNAQTVGTTKVTEQKLVRPVARGNIEQSNNTNKVQADSVETVVVNEIPVWAIALGLFGFIVWSYLLWKLPTPDRIWNG